MQNNIILDLHVPYVNSVAAIYWIIMRTELG